MLTLVISLSNMETLTIKDVETACKELQEALVETISLDKASDKIKIQQAKARKRLQIARDIVYHLKIN